MESEYASVLENKEDRENIYKMDSKEKVLFIFKSSVGFFNTLKNIILILF